MRRGKWSRGCRLLRADIDDLLFTHRGRWTLLLVTTVRAHRQDWGLEMRAPTASAAASHHPACNRDLARK